MKVYDTTIIKDAILAKYDTFADFCRIASSKTGLDFEMVRRRVAGKNSAPSDKEVAVYAKLLDLKPEEIRNCYKKKVEQYPQTATSSPTSGSRSVVVDWDSLSSATEKAGLTKTALCRILGISSSSFSNWKHNPNVKTSTLIRMAELLKVSVEDLVKKENVPAESVEAPAPAESNTTNNISAPSKEGNIERLFAGKFDKLENETNMQNILKQINLNTILLAQAMVILEGEQVEASIALYKELKELRGEVEALRAGSVPVKEEPVVEEEPATPTIIVKASINDLINGYKDTDDFDAYRNKINQMVGIIKETNPLTFKQILHQYYKAMQKTWGAVYEQLEKDFYKRHGRKHNHGSMELLYDDPDFRQIFYNMVASDLSNRKAS